jgi:hypothetical protein
MLDEDVNPMEGAINIVDAMLVFACGLMLSLVIYWNVDLRTNEMIPVTQGLSVEATEEMAESIGGDSEGESSYEEVGKVYRDPVTGKLYLAETDTGIEAGSGEKEGGAGTE